ncbi:hypothetical protein L596_028604 [Steinernema carpocapsae]|uniref:Uncharacterized protein n=1 Tax=Steinernema carpocapsae TaxID=34508 RepID=A0A4U5LYV6_STECR|nr:hypothetical protein L596_028604 [Steinernema carpocapsae]
MRGCPSCDGCPADEQTTQAPRVMLNEWIDCREGDDFPTDKQVIRALGRPLKAEIGNQDQYVVLWWRHGVPLMGRAWNAHGKILASFAETRIHRSDRGANVLPYRTTPADGRV